MQFFRNSVFTRVRWRPDLFRGQYILNCLLTLFPQRLRFGDFTPLCAAATRLLHLIVKISLHVALRPVSSTPQPKNLGNHGMCGTELCREPKTCLQHREQCLYSFSAAQVTFRRVPSALSRGVRYGGGRLLCALRTSL